jgi:hypothetical protein
LSQVWSLVAPTGGNYLLVQPYSFGYYDFIFQNNRYASTIDSSVYAQWNVFQTEDVPGNVVVDLYGNTVYIHNGIW